MAADAGANFRRCGLAIKTGRALLASYTVAFLTGFITRNAEAIRVVAILGQKESWMAVGALVLLLSITGST